MMAASQKAKGPEATGIAPSPISNPAKGKPMCTTNSAGAAGKQAAGSGMSLTRRLFLRHGAAAAAATAVSAPAIAETDRPLTPDERIEAAIAEITAAFREKWPDCPLRVDDVDNGHAGGMLVIITQLGRAEPGSVQHLRWGQAREQA